MGAEDGPHPEDGEGPVRPVELSAFSIAATSVTNAEFARFVRATGYRTVAERAGASFVFMAALAEPDAFPSAPLAPWWRGVEGAFWARPKGPGGDLDALWDHPVTHVAQADALAYCRWSGTRLPTEAEWEYAARGGLARQPFPWGAELEPGGRRCSNTWRGPFPEGGYRHGTEEVTRYAPNGFGLCNTTGNVWERVADRFTTLHSRRCAKDPKGPLNGDLFVAKGGSHLCHASYCRRYRTSSRMALDPRVTTSHIGFRVAR